MIIHGGAVESEVTNGPIDRVFQRPQDVSRYRHARVGIALERERTQIEIWAGRRATVLRTMIDGHSSYEARLDGDEFRSIDADRRSAVVEHNSSRRPDDVLALALGPALVVTDNAAFASQTIGLSLSVQSGRLRLGRRVRYVPRDRAASAISELVVDGGGRPVTAVIENEVVRWTWLFDKEADAVPEPIETPAGSHAEIYDFHPPPAIDETGGIEVRVDFDFQSSTMESPVRQIVIHSKLGDVLATIGEASKDVTVTRGTQTYRRAHGPYEVTITGPGEDARDLVWQTLLTLIRNDVRAQVVLKDDLAGLAQAEAGIRAEARKRASADRRASEAQRLLADVEAARAERARAEMADQQRLWEERRRYDEEMEKQRRREAKSRKDDDGDLLA